MSKISAKEIKKLREETGAGVMDVRRALADSKGETEAAKKILKKRVTIITEQVERLPSLLLVLVSLLS